jgi:predicted cupin superfamily sugar epimerase
MLQLYPNGTTKTVILGHDIEAGQSLQITVPKNVWQGSYLLDGGEYALMGTTMSPGFEFVDNVIGDINELIKLYPGAEELIKKLTD